MYANEIESIKLKTNPSTINKFLESKQTVEPKEEQQQSLYLPDVMQVINSYLSLDDKYNLVEALSISKNITESFRQYGLFPHRDHLGHLVIPVEPNPL